MSSFLEKSKELKAEVEGELREVSIVKAPFYDTNKITGVLQRFKTAYLKTALEATIDGLTARSEVEARAVIQVARSMNEIDKAIRILQRKLKPLLQSCETDVREQRGERLRALVRSRERSATLMESLVRGHRVRQAIRRCGGVNYWVEAVDEDGMTYYFNTWTQERLEADLPPYEMRLFGGRGGKGKRGAGTSSSKIGGDLLHPEESPWTECYDEESGEPYYFNSETGEYAWERPMETDVEGNQRWLEQEHMSQLTERGGGGGGGGGGMDASAMSSLSDVTGGPLPTKPKGPARVAGEWEELWDEESLCCYYLNKESGEFHWEKPGNFDQSWLETQDTDMMTSRSVSKRDAGPWQELFDPETSTTYYYNERNGESRWERPKGFDQRWLDQQDVAALTARSTKRRNAGDWVEMQDEETGTVYYTNMHTSESQWEKPSGFDGQVRCLDFCLVLDFGFCLVLLVCWLLGWVVFSFSSFLVLSHLFSLSPLSHFSSHIFSHSLSLSTLYSLLFTLSLVAV